MIQSPAYDLAKMAETESEFGLVVGENLFVSLLPDNPANCAAFLDSGGYPAQTNYQYEKPTVQILVRGSSYDEAYPLALDLKRFFNGQQEIIINNSRYILIRNTTEPLVMYDAHKRPIISVNFLIHRVNVG